MPLSPEQPSAIKNMLDRQAEQQDTQQQQQTSSFSPDYLLSDIQQLKESVEFYHHESPEPVYYIDETRWGSVRDWTGVVFSPGLGENDGKTITTGIFGNKFIQVGMFQACQ